MKAVYKLIIIFFICSCDGDSQRCQLEEDIYRDSWNEIIQEMGMDKRYKASYYILTDKRSIRVRMCEVIIYGKPGDSIVKPKNSFIADVYRNGNIEFTSRVISESCDTIVDTEYEYLDYEELKQKHPHLINWRW